MQNPTVKEILDGYRKTAKIDAIKSFKTNDKFAADTYCDAMKKHTAIHGGAYVTPSSLLSVSGEFVRKFTDSGTADIRHSTEGSPLSLFCDGCATSSAFPTFELCGEVLGIHKGTPRTPYIPLEKSSMIALLPRTNIPREEYESEAVQLLSAAEVSGVIFAPFVFDARGVMGKLCDIGAVADIDMESYPQNNKCDTFTDLLCAFDSYAGFFVTDKKKKLLLPAIQSSCFVAVECAKMLTGDNIKILRQGKVVAEIDIADLKANADILFADIVCEPQNACADKINSKTVMLNPLATIPTKADNISDIYTGAKNAIACAKCTLDDYTLDNSIVTALLPILELSARGIDRKSMTVTKRLRYSNDNIASALEAILASHRVTSELVLSCDSSKAKKSDGENDLVIFARGNIEKNAPLPANSFAGNGKIYILSAVPSNIRTIDFARTRHLLDYLSQAVQSGGVTAARVFVNTPIDTAIDSMRSEGAEASVDASAIKCPTVYILIESSKNLRGTNIGYSTDISDKSSSEI